MAAVRVAFDVGPLAAPRTGIGHAVAAMHAELGARDDVELTDYLISFRARPEEGVRRLPLPALVAHRLWSHFDHPRADRWMGDAQVVHGTNYVVPPSRLPRVVSVYDCWFLRHPSAAGGDVRRAGRVLARAVAGGVAVHACSQATAMSIAEHLPGAVVEVVPLGALPVAAPPPRPPIPELEGRSFVLAIGTLERRKNLPRLVEAFGLAASEQPDVALVLAGSDGDDRAAIDKAIDALGPAVARRVLLTGRVDDGARSWLLHHAAVLAYPSLDEGFGFPLLDAMQVGVPIVASTAGSIPEIAGDAALLGAPDDAAGMAANLLAALGDTEVRSRLVAAGSVRWRQFTWQRCAAGMAGLYGRLADGEAR